MCVLVYEKISSLENNIIIKIPLRNPDLQNVIKC